MSSTLASFFSLRSPVAFALAVMIAIATAIVARRRRPDFSKPALAAVAAGLFLLVLAAGSATWLRSRPGRVAVMVDLSPSTRTASYREPAALRRRIHQLLGTTPYEIIAFASEKHASLSGSSPLSDLPAERTVFAPPQADAVLLFSDGRFELPVSSPRTYPVIDPLLENPEDSAVRELDLRGTSLAATVYNGASADRVVRYSAAPATRPAGPGTTTLLWPAPAPGARATVRLTGDDAWPENDALSMIASPTTLSQRWWVGPARTAPAGFRTVEALPLDPAEYLAPAVIVLENAAASDFSEVQQGMLRAYVEELGGSLLILGGDRAFAAGEYPGSVLESLSPLASSPPLPTLHWILLLDSSGSMDVRQAGATRWGLATRALLHLLPAIPPEDPVTVGSFAEELRWWSRGHSARETSRLPLPPADILPRGPTNLEPTLAAIAADAADGLPRELLILSDADADVLHPEELAAAMNRRRIRVHLLALSGEGRGRPALARIAAATGGNVVEELDPRRWTAAAQRLFTLATPERLGNERLPVRFVGPAAALPEQVVSPWNRTWLKTSPRPATLLAESRRDAEHLPMAAQWQIGAGTVLAVAFHPTIQAISGLAQKIAQPPQDPRFRVTCRTGAEIRVLVDAVDQNRYLNRQQLTYDLTFPAGVQRESGEVPQIAPGRYEFRLPAPRVPGILSIRHQGRLIDRIALAGRYPREFDGLGNDIDALRSLARATGGQIVVPTQNTPIDFGWPHQQISLASPLAAASAALIAIGLLLNAGMHHAAARRAIDFRGSAHASEKP